MAPLHEAAELYLQASEMARLQVASELEMAFADDGFGDDVKGGDGDGMAGSSAACSTEQMVLFWVEQGLSEARATRLVQQLEREQEELRRTDASGGTVAPGGAHGPPPPRLLLTPNQLSARLSRLQRVLPGVDVPALVAGDPPLLRVRTDAALLNMIALVDRLPGCSAVELVVQTPRLLWLDDMAGRIDKVFSKLMSLHPSRDERVVAEIVGENPSLLWRIPDYYMGAMLIDDLPIEIQNMMVLSDQGIGFLYKYYRMQRQHGDGSAGWDRGSKDA